MCVKVFLFFILVLIPSVISVRLTTSNETDLASDTVGSTEEWPSDITCDFDSFSMCGWKNRHEIADDFDWKLGTRKDSYRRRKKNRTGVKDDYGKGKVDYGKPDGGYLYISAGRFKNRTAKLISKSFKISEAGCMRFWYHMRGRHMGHLKLFEMKLGKIQSLELLWEVYGGQGALWNEGVVSIKPSASTMYFLFEAFDWEAGPAGNIVLDDIEFDPLTDEGECVFKPVDAAPPTEKPMTTSTLLPYSTMAVLETSEKAQATSISSVVTIPPTSGFESTTTVRAETRQFTSSTQDVENITLKATESQQNETLRTASSAVVNTYTSFYNTATSKDNGSSSIATSTKTSESQFTTKMTLKHFASQTINQNDETSGQNEIVPKRPRDNSTIFVVVSVCMAFVIVSVALLWFLRYRKRRSFNFYDNSTVHMTRMYPEVVKSETFLEYTKLS